MNGPPGGSPFKRHLPVQQKEMVYNEWGAVIKHQDEMHQALKQSEFKRNKDLQLMYRHELDNQRAMVAQQKQDSRMRDEKMSNSMLAY
mmetsp:Transcript_23955/g.36709  ORF Transcript_23955/g.36709 Transcript_23955/m.36709 type:complete len:88 (+) Transcript_23955:1288-1551(+)